MGTKIQINSLAALERLIGGDSEVELEIRQSVVTEFVKKHLKGIADQAIVYRARHELRDNINLEVEKQIKETIGEFQTSGYGARKFIIRNDIKEDINRSLKEAIHGIVLESFNELIPTLKDKVEDSLSRILETRIHQMVKEKLDQKLAQIKESL